MNNYYTLRFPDEFTALRIAGKLKLTDEDGSILTCLGHLGDISDIGTISIFSRSGADVEQTPITISGYFVNVVLAERKLPSVLEEYIVPYGSSGQCFSGSIPSGVPEDLL
jgi:hypothetical protein